MMGYQKATTINESLDALRHPKRRRLLFCLLERTEASGIDARCTLPSVFDEYNGDARIELIHSHLPKLEQYGFIDWEADDQTVEPGPRWEEIEPTLTVLYTHLDELPANVQGTPSTRGQEG